MGMADDPTLQLLEALDDPLLSALADPTRARLIRALVQLGPADISTIAESFPQDRSVISRHLRILHEAGLVRASKEGRHVWYALDGPALLQRLEALLAKARAAVASCCP